VKGEGLAAGKGQQEASCNACGVRSHPIDRETTQVKSTSGPHDHNYFLKGSSDNTFLIHLRQSL